MSVAVELPNREFNRCPFTADFDVLHQFNPHFICWNLLACIGEQRLCFHVFILDFERFVQETQFTLFSDFKYLFRLVEMQGGDFLFTRCQPKRQASDKVNHSFHAAALFTYLLHNSRPP